MQHFVHYGTIVSARIATDKDTSRNRGFGEFGVVSDTILVLVFVVVEVCGVEGERNGWTCCACEVSSLCWW